MNTRTVKVVCFAGLRKYFGSEASVSVDQNASFRNILNELEKLNTEASEVLGSCRIAVNEQFVALDQPLNKVSTVFLIPPSSGG